MLGCAVFDTRSHFIQNTLNNDFSHSLTLKTGSAPLVQAACAAAEFIVEQCGCSIASVSQVTLLLLLLLLLLLPPPPLMLLLLLLLLLRRFIRP